MVRYSFGFAALVTALAACDPHAQSSAERWAHAESLWREKSPSAYRAWRSLDPASDEGRKAAVRLALAEAHYLRGIERLREGQPGSREALLDGVARAPMDPALYLPLARACKQRQLPLRAAEFYRKYLQQGGSDPQARAELAQLDAPLDDIFDPAAPPVTALAPPPTVPGWLAVSGGTALLLALVGLLAVWQRGRGRRSLVELAQASPELHPALAYLIGCLRHELLKHRILAVGDAVRALAAGTPLPGQRAFLLARLFSGEPLRVAWAGHLGTFIRALGPRFDLARGDRGFREAGRAVGELASLEVAFARGDADAPARLERAYERLRAFDRTLGAFAAGLTQTPVDAALLREVVDAVRAEYAAGQVALDEVQLAEVPAGVAVEVYRLDLVLILKNLTRNAILAVGRAPAPRRIALDVQVCLEPTGEEIVRVRVRDSSPEPLSPGALIGRAQDRGLGIVTTALDRYDGCLELLPAADGFEKGVAVRLFRALGDEPAPPLGAVA